MLKLIVVPAGAFTKPLPGLTFTWPVKTCGSPTAFVSSCGVIWMFASTQFFTALALSPARPSPVARFSVTPPTTTVVAARTVVTPAVDALFSVTVQEPVVPIVVQLAGVSDPGPLTMLKLIVVPAGAFT